MVGFIKKPPNNDNNIPTFEKTKDEFKDCVDLNENTIPHLSLEYLYIDNLAKETLIREFLVRPFDKGDFAVAISVLSEKRYKEVIESELVFKGILEGNAAIFFKGRAYLVNVSGPISRSIDESETESVITGPHDSFIESAGQNLSLIRRRIKSSTVVAKSINNTWFNG
jgi:hypothetical protein